MRRLVIGLAGVVSAVSLTKLHYWIKMNSSESMLDQKFLPPLIEGGAFQCPWAKWHRPGLVGFLWAKFREGNHTNIPSQKELDNVAGMEVQQLNQSKVQRPVDLQVTWLGHATALVQIEGVNVLTDPVFSSTIGPVQMLGLTRYRKCPCLVDDLPQIHAVVISHDHFDHLDLNSVMMLHQRFGSSMAWYVPTGMKQWLLDSVGSDANVVEMSWWEERELLLDINRKRKNIRFACVPAQHWGRRGMFDENKRLWSGWVVKGSTKSVFFAGDTGYCEVFKQIGEKFGPIDVGLIPIGAYKPRDFMKFQHCDPEEAVKIHLDVKAKHSIGIHWGTFNMGSTEFYLEPRELLREFSKKAGVDTFVTVCHGETVQF